MARTDKFDFEDVASVYGHLDKLTAILVDLDKEADRSKSPPTPNFFINLLRRLKAFEEEEVVTETLAFYTIIAAIILIAAIALLIAFCCNRFASAIHVIISIYNITQAYFVLFSSSNYFPITYLNTQIAKTHSRRMKGGPLNISGSESSTNWNTNSPDLEVLFFSALHHLFF